MAHSRNVFLVGAGYIGLNVLDQLLEANHSVTVLVRRPEQAALLEKKGVKTVSGTLSDLEVLTAQTAQHEITINTASCDDLPSVEAILSGVRQRVKAGYPTIYLHTSGTGALEDGALGMSKNDKVYRDDVPEDVNAVSPESMHRHVDIPITQAAREFGDKAKVVIILPPLVYGYNPAHGRHSFPVTSLVRFAVKRGFAGYVGEGVNTWSVIHVKDLGRAYRSILEYVDASSPKTFLDNPFFFAENGAEITMRETAEKLAQILRESGHSPDSKAQPFTEDDYKDVFGPMTPRGFGCNSRSRAIRLREVGWEPKEKDIWTSWREDEVPSLVAMLNAPSES